MTKYILIFVTALLTANVALAQEKENNTDENEYHTLFGSRTGETKVSGFGTFSMDFGSIDNNLGLMMGGEGAVLINRSFFIGFYGRALANMPLYSYTYYGESDSKNITVDRRAAFAHGGMLIGTVFNATKPMHFGLSIRIGGGGVSLVENYTDNGSYNHEKNYYNYPYVAPIFVMSPQVDFEMNLTNWMKFKVSAGYQYVADAPLNYKVLENGSFVEKELLNVSMYSTPTLSMGFVFGWFK